MDNLNLNDTLTFYHQLTQASTGAAFNATGSPTWRIYHAANGTPILTGTMTALDAANVTGLYYGQVVLSAANGFTIGEPYCVRTGATVDGVAAGGIATEFIVRDGLFTALITAIVTATVSGVWTAADGGCQPGRTGNMNRGAHLDQLWRAAFNYKVPNGSTFTVFCDDETSIMMSGNMGMGPTFTGMMIGPGDPPVPINGR